MVGRVRDSWLQERGSGWGSGRLRRGRGKVCLLLDLDVGRRCGLCRDVLGGKDGGLATIAVDLRGKEGGRGRKSNMAVYSAQHVRRYI